MGNFASTSPAAKHLVDTLLAQKADRQNSMSASTGTAAPTPEVQPTTGGDLSVNRRKRRGKASLIIDRTNPTNTGTGGSGLNI